MQIIIWIVGAIAAYRLWDNYVWLSVLVAILAISYEVSAGDKHEHATKGMYSSATGSRLMFTFIGVVAIFIFSLFA